MSHLSPSANPEVPAIGPFHYSVRLPDGRTESVITSEHFDVALATGPADAARAALALRRYARMHEGVALRLEQAANSPELVVAPSVPDGPPVLQLLGSGVPASTCPEGPFDVTYPASDLERDWPCEPGGAQDAELVAVHGRVLVERALALARVEREVAQEHRARAARIAEDPSTRGRWAVEKWMAERLFTWQSAVLRNERALLEGRAAVLLPVARTPLEQGVHAGSTSS